LAQVDQALAEQLEETVAIQFLAQSLQQAVAVVVAVTTRTTMETLVVQAAVVVLIAKALAELVRLDKATMAVHVLARQQTEPLVVVVLVLLEQIQLAATMVVQAAMVRRHQ
jgi:hypothetical protein